MISFILACTLWSKPEVKNIEIPVDEYAMATMDVDFNDHHFEASVMEEKMNYIKIVSNKTGASSQAYSMHNYELTALSVKVSDKESEATLDCVVRPQSSEINPK